MAGFTPRTFEEITADSISLAASLTDRASDFNVGSVLRALLEAAAVEVERAEVGFAVGLQQGIVESAYTLWRFPRLPASRAYGLLRLTADPAPGADIPIPRGSRFGVPSTMLYYQTEEDYTFPDGASSYDLVVVAVEAGSIGNVAANCITQVISDLTGVTGCTNPEAFFTGADEENDEQRRARFAEYVRSLHRGTEDALELGALLTQVVDVSGYTTEQVVDARAMSTPGHVTVYIWNGVDGASSTLQAACLTMLNGRVLGDGQRVPGYKAAGITVAVAEATQVAVSVTVTVSLEVGYDLDYLRSSIVTAIQGCFQGLRLGETLYPSAISCAARHVPGVLDVTVTAPSSAVAAAHNEIVVLSGTPVVTAPATPALPD